MDELLRIYKTRFIGICISGIIGFLMLTGIGIWLCFLDKSALIYGLPTVAGGIFVGILSFFLCKYMRNKIKRIEAEKNNKNLYR